MPISFVCLYMFKCDVCMLNHMWIKQKKILFFLFAFGSDLYYPCFSKFFKIFFLCEKHVFLGVFVIYLMCQFSHELKDPILKFFSFGQRVSRLYHDCFVSKAYQRNTNKIPAKFSREANQRNYQQKFPDQLLKGISWDICFKLLPSSPKPLF